ncbi:hypothetical protein SAMN04488508_1203 [Aquimarina spongiae]|uniref:Uncharacterized protein n=1 Tax=Aquimarina spongiae TaxID=570521 RepID=A0A1M6LLN8_9FLAO|nr:hypothetical protein SAMN04488508_1203 [Aquimarina spongiae]
MIGLFHFVLSNNLIADINYSYPLYPLEGLLQPCKKENAKPRYMNSNIKKLVSMIKFLYTYLLQLVLRILLLKHISKTSTERKE